MIVRFLASHLLLLFLVGAAHGAWTPPEKPDPMAILQEAESDRQAGRFADALAKQVWFHENALKFNESMTGVRLSFALSYWHRLGKVYPPALEKLKEVRNEHEKAVRARREVADSFGDFAAINRELGEQKLTTELFAWLDANSAEGAESVFVYAEDDLLRAQQYELASKYIKPERDLEILIQMHRHEIEFSKNPQAVGPDFLKYAEEQFSTQATTLVALLVKANRRTEAESIAAKARQERDAPDLSESLKKAMEGIFPKP